MSFITLDKNDKDAPLIIDQIKSFLIMNKQLKHLNLSGCLIGQWIK